jgi:hypothetical protein
VTALAGDKTPQNLFPTQSNEVNVMKNNISSFRPIRWSAIIFTLTLVTTNISAADNQFTERFDFKAGQTLSLDFSSGGSISIESWDQPGIEVTYGDKDNSLDQYSIDIENNAAGLTVNAWLAKSNNSSSIHFTFKPPR